MKQVYKYKDANMASCHNCATIHHGKGEEDKVNAVVSIVASNGSLAAAVRDHVRNYQHTDGTPCIYAKWPVGKVVARSRWAWGLRLYHRHEEEVVT